MHTRCLLHILCSQTFLFLRCFLTSYNFLHPHKIKLCILVSSDSKHIWNISFNIYSISIYTQNRFYISKCFFFSQSEAIALFCPAREITLLSMCCTTACCKTFSFKIVPSLLDYVCAAHSCSNNVNQWKMNPLNFSLAQLLSHVWLYLHINVIFFSLLTENCSSFEGLASSCTKGQETGEWASISQSRERPLFPLCSFMSSPTSLWQ